MTLRTYVKWVALATFFLILAGGLVTSTGSGLSVPDWPLSFGTLFPKMEGGVFFEHGHRLVAGTVVLLTLVLVFRIFSARLPRPVRALSMAAILAIFLQAALGGLTVLLRLPPLVSVAHAGLAQAFFCMVVTLALWLSPGWSKPEPREEAPAWLPWITLLTPCLIYAQILLGAVMRHIGAGLAIPDFPLAFGHLVPPRETWNLWVLVHFAHRVGALGVAILALAAALGAGASGVPRLKSLGSLSMVLLAIQVGLGAATIWSQKAILPATAHVGVGALLLATHWVLFLESRRLLTAKRSFRASLVPA